MRDADWNRLWSLFHRAAALSASERNALLEAECAGEPELRAELEALLVADRQPPSLLAGLESATGEAVAPERIGPWRVIGPLGHGGMGTVWLAERDDGAYAQQVAIKLATAARFSPAHRRRFESERHALAALRHPDIARILDGGLLADGVPYVVMEHIDGVPIDRWCDETDAGLQTRLRLLWRICEAVHHAHSRLVIHCDLKPSNILVENGQPRLLDFGLARLLADEARGIDATTGVFATPGYASPEQLRGEVLGTATDIYSLGVLACRLIAGALPYRLAPSSLAEAVRVVCDEDPLPPSRVVAADSAIARVEPRLTRKLRGDLDRIVLKALAKDPQARYGSAAELGEDLHRYLQGRPVQARRIGTAARMAKFVRRHPVAVGSAAAAVAGLLALTLVLARTAAERAVALEQAQARTRQAESVTAFLTDTFSAADVLARSAASPSLDQVLDAATARLDTGLAGQPAIQARLLTTLGSVRRNLGDYDEAQELLRRAEALQEGDADTAATDLAATRIALAQVRLDQGDAADAVTRLDGVLGKLDVEDPAADPLRASAFAARAAAHQRGSRFDAALADIDQALALSADGDRYAHAMLLRRRASILVSLGRYADARVPAAKAFQGMHTLYGEQHERTLAVLTLLATIELRDGKLETAAAQFERVLEGRVAYLPQDHPLVLDTRVRLAGALIELQHTDRAGELLERTLEAQRRADPDAPLVPYVLNNLALIRFRQHRHDEAEALAEQALAYHRARHGEQHDSVATSLSNLAEFAFASGRLDRAERLQRDALVVREAVVGPGHPDVATSLASLAQILLRQGRAAEAEPLLSRAAAIQQRSLAPDHPDRAYVLAARGELALHRGNAAAAAVELRAALAVREAVEGADEPLTADIRAVLARAQDAAAR